MKILIFTFLFVFAFAQSQMISSIYFEKNSDVLDNKSKTKLDSLSKLNSNLIFRVYGNCDPSGTADYNKILSDKRAKNVYNYLSKKAKSNIKFGNTIGLGFTKQINDNSSEELRKLNRRVDIFIEKNLAAGEKIERKRYPSFFDVKVNDMKVKDTFSLPEINFIGGKHRWLPSASKKMFQLARILNDNPSLEVELQGHICCDYENFDGEDLELGTMNLSVTRAESIKKYLELQGVKANRILAKGLGHLNPMVYPEITEEDKTKNRRVEIMIVKK